MSNLAKRRLNPRKLLLSKWTASRPQNRERHFLVTKLLRDEQEQIVAVELQAVLTGRNEQIDWRLLLDSERWQQGWR
ncbi:conserved hypothetical protein [Pseudomonas sp. 8Z]|uniref:TIGR02450 family Trp-rich protein n=1 Tax=Pseudomonas sp. 8Z TaxID=2653166 RepID=UPI0012F427F5|nr:TIGR02450 family Trp-rich protein [Pseudomonas sp. 8Z]VXC49164.1 conserved hypothetical protein [Pseudomonas sp. 8Z]